MNRRGEAKETLRRRIMNVALDLFSKQGFDAVTVEQIAGQSGVSPMTVFRHFGTKADIVFSDTKAGADALRSVASSCGPADDPRRRVADCLLRFAAESGQESSSWTLRSRIVAQSLTLQRLAAAGRAECESALIEGLAEHAHPEQAVATEVAAVAGLAVFHRAVQASRQQRTSLPLDAAVAQALDLLWPDLR